MDYTISKSGELIFTLDDEERSEWAEQIAREDQFVDIATVFSETGLAGNCDLDMIQPEDVGALTDSPIFADDVDLDDQGELRAVGDVWWYPDYQIFNPAEVLVEKGQVIFTPAPENSTRHAA